jgi:hypothetical protein
MAKCALFWPIFALILGSFPVNLSATIDYPSLLRSFDRSGVGGAAQLR